MKLKIIKVIYDHKIVARPLNLMAQQLGKLGGKASVKSRFEGKTKKEISEIMKSVRSKKKS